MLKAKIEVKYNWKRKLALNNKNQLHNRNNNKKSWKADGHTDITLLTIE